MKDMYKVAILIVEKGDEALWGRSLTKCPRLITEIIDLGDYDWFERCTQTDFDVYFCKAPGQTNLQKQMFDERIAILNRYLDKLIYPSLHELEIYENKKFLSYWLKAYSIPHPKTWVFYDKKDALGFLTTARYPMVAKINIGSSGKGVKILKTASDISSYISIAFSKGVKPYIGPNFRTSNLGVKLRNALKIKGLIQKRLGMYKAIGKESQHYIIIQEYIPHSFEWRAVRIGDSYFAHKKMMKDNMASGSLMKDYSNPPLELMDFVKQVCSKADLTSVSMDVFQTPDGFLVNEIQTYFGQSDSYQMMVDGVIGRYVFTDSGWCFEAGDFNGNESYDLRVQHLLSILDNK